MNIFKKLLFLIFILTACGGSKESMIGVQTLKNVDGTKSVVWLQSFDSKDSAVNFYHKKGVTDYVLMVHPEKEEKTVFAEIDAKEDDGKKTVEFITENGILSEDRAFEYLYEDLGLEIQCVFDGTECK
jgi:hypothetical protein